jgi:hypothetical protein
MYQKFQKIQKKKKKRGKKQQNKGVAFARAGIDIAERDDGKRAQEAGEEESRGCGGGGFWRERKKGGDGGGFKRIETAERFEPTNTKGGSFPFESDTLTVGGTSGVSGQTRIVPDADEKQRERRGENAGIRVEGTV